MSLNDFIERIVVGLDLVHWEILYDYGEQDHAQLFVNKFVWVRVGEEKLEEIIPFLIGDEEFAKRANNICDVFLDQRDGFFNESGE